MGRLKILVLCLVVVGAPSLAYAEPGKAVLRDPFTSNEVSFSESELSPAEVSTELESSGIPVPKWIKACDKQPDPVIALENRLELEFMIDSLKSDKERILTLNQKEFLAKMPLCKAYLMELKVIALLLRKYEIVQLPDPSSSLAKASKSE